MKKVTFITALLIALMLLISCGGNEPENPVQKSESLSGRMFKYTNDVIGTTETWYFAPNKPADYRKEGDYPCHLYYSYTQDTENKLLTLQETDSHGNTPQGKIILKEYEWTTDGIKFKEAIPHGIDLETMASDYWLPTFKSSYSEEPYLSIDFENEIVTYKTGGTSCQYNLIVVADGIIGVTKKWDMPMYSSFPYGLSIDYEEMDPDSEVINVTVEGTDLELTCWLSSTSFVEQ